MARGILLIVLGCFSVVVFLDVLTTRPSPHAVPWCAVSLMAAVTLQIQHSSPATRNWSTARRAYSLVLQGIVTYLPVLVIKREWGGMAGFLAGSVLLLVPGPLSWILFGAVVLSVCVPGIVLSGSLLDVVYLTVSTTVIGLIVYGLSRLAGLVAGLQATREDLAQLAVVREQLRFASDIHDLLSFNLSAITLKSELAHRLVGVQPERARREISEVRSLSRQALADVRQVAHGYRRLSFVAETRRVRAALAAAQINCETDFGHGPLPPQTDTILAIVLREAATNVLRHSNATRCTITTRTTGKTKCRIRLSVTNNGVSRKLSASQPVGGMGLASLTERLSALHGDLTAGVTSPGVFELVADIPSQPEQCVVHRWATDDQGTTMA